MATMIWPWVIFISFVLVMLALDLGVFHRESHEVTFKEAMAWSAFWISLGVAFSVVVYFAYEAQWFGLGTHREVGNLTNNGKLAATKYLTGYVVEKSLSVDNIFVIAMIFSGMGVPGKFQHRVLFWGILGALVLRGTMIGLGSALVSEFHWVLYLFGVFLVFTGIKMWFSGDEEESAPEEHAVVRLVRKFFPVTDHFHGPHFLVRAGSPQSLKAVKDGDVDVDDDVVKNAVRGTRLLTPLAIALIMVEITDLIFAVDSIPAIFAITSDPFLVFTSNVFAILGLRSLYFALAGMIQEFRYLKPALSLVLLVVGVKMLAVHWLKIWLGDYFNVIILGLILAILTGGVVMSMVARNRERKSH